MECKLAAAGVCGALRNEVIGKMSFGDEAVRLINPRTQR